MPDTSVLSDEKLVACYQDSGDGDAIAELVQRHLPRVNSLVRQMVFDESAADDLTQEVFLRAIRSMSGFRRKSTFGTWLFRIALNTTYNHLKQSGNGRVEYRPTVPEPGGNRSTVPDAVMEAEVDAEIQAALSELSPKLRAAIVLTCLQQMPVKDAAKAEGCTAATMYWRVHQARKQLQSRLEKYLSS
jgi:RNA polymerase sigma-70 factor (ECF subfamily)